MLSCLYVFTFIPLSVILSFRQHSFVPLWLRVQCLGYCQFERNERRWTDGEWFLSLRRVVLVISTLLRVQVQPRTRRTPSPTPYTQCPVVDCGDKDCSVGGFAKDAFGCTLCICDDPCQVCCPSWILIIIIDCSEPTRAGNVSNALQLIYFMIPRFSAQYHHHNIHADNPHLDPESLPP